MKFVMSLSLSYRRKLLPVESTCTSTFLARWVLQVLCALHLLSSSPVALVEAASPVIGILTQPIHDSNHTKIAASYVKWLEAGGARSIPIPYDAPVDMVHDIFGQIDGILFPGGGSDLPDSAVHLWTLLQTAYTQQHKDLLPLWGTCLGFEFLLQLGSGDTSILEGGFVAENISLPLYQVERHRLYQDDALYRSIQENNITMNNHHQGISPASFEKNERLTKYWKITSVNTDLSGKSFASTIEPVDPEHFPVYGVQFHPEKNAFEYATYPHTNIPYEAIDHSAAGIAMSLYMASFFVDLVRRNPAYGGPMHRYTKPDTYPLVYSYPMERGVQFEQVYVIPPASTYLEPSKHVDGDIFEAVRVARDINS
jgi:gamma-glutamyl hydrolase